MRIFLLVTAMALAACGELEPLVARPVMNDAECRTQTLAAPEVRRTGRELNADNQSNVRRVTSERNEAERRIYEDCLRRRGLSISGGVEPIRQIR